MALAIVGGVVVLWLGITLFLFLLHKQDIFSLYGLHLTWMVAPWEWIYGRFLWWSLGDLNSSDRDRRYYAVRRLRRKHPRIIDALSNALADSYRHVRWEAAESLRAMGWTPSPDKEEAFARALEEKDADWAEFRGHLRGAQIKTLSRVLKCHGCSTSVPPLLIGRMVTEAPFGKCNDCGLIWCSNCWIKVDRGAWYSHDCPRCNKTLSTELL